MTVEREDGSALASDSRALPARARGARSVALSVALALLVALFGCGDGSGGGGGESAGGFVSALYMQERSLDFLEFATQTFAPHSITNVIAHMERDRVDPTYSVEPEAVPADAWDPIFEKMAALRDTRDFDALELLHILFTYGDHPMLPAELVAKVEESLLSFKMWFVEPTPDGLVDDSYYWTENHQILFHTIEYLVGQRYPDRALSTDGASGREHRERARALLLRWLELRVRFGFSEWHSNVYYQENLNALLTLVELADEEEIRVKAASVLDLLLFDMAMHTFRGAFGVTHGRSYKKDKMTSLHDDTWNGVKLLFDESTYPYQSASATDAVLLSSSRRYRMPEAILRIAKSSDASTDRERMSIPIHEFGPYEPDPVAAYGLSYTDPDDLLVWWGMGAHTIWPVVPLTVQIFDQYDLWSTEAFSDFAGLRPLTANIEFAQNVALGVVRMLGFALLKEVNTVTYRTADYMLSSAVDYRKGSFGSQVHAWQATLDANAVVFTTHAFRPPLRSTVWRDDTETGSYWTGEASMPRSAQHENVAVHIYAPQYPPQNPPPFDFFRYEPYTHAYFPQDHFDEVVQEQAAGGGQWTLGRLGDGYIALYSFRPTEWITYDPTEFATNGMVRPFDLRASGGANNVWIAECGRAADWGSFAAFREAIAAAAVEVTPLGPLEIPTTGFDVSYESPAHGRITFGWESPFTVSGAEIPTADFPRYDNPWSQTAINSLSTAIEKDGYGIAVDFAAGTRTAHAPAR